jgi:hypothetical protein
VARARHPRVQTAAILNIAVDRCFPEFDEAFMLLESFLSLRGHFKTNTERATLPLMLRDLADLCAHTSGHHR